MGISIQGCLANVFRTSFVFFSEKATFALKSISLIFIFIALLGNLGWGQTAGPNYPSVGASVFGVGTIGWGTPTSIYADDAAYATATNVPANGGASNYLRATGFNFAIPNDVTINGITVTINRYASATTGVYDNIVSLVKGGAIQATNKASATVWSGNANTVVTYGGPADLWGSTWTAADINAANFGAVLSVRNTDNRNRTANVDYIRISVTYSCPSYSLASILPVTPILAGNTSTVTLTGNAVNLPVRTYTVTYNLSAPNAATGLTAPMIVSTAGTGSFVTEPLISVGATTITITNIASGFCASAISANNTAIIVTTLPPGGGCRVPVDNMYPTAPIPAPNIGFFQININQPQDYNLISNVVAGSVYTSAFVLSVIPYSPGYITVCSGGYPGTRIASGYSPLTWTATTSGTYSIYYTIDDVCGTSDALGLSVIIGISMLPVDLLSFNASCDNDKVNILWSTATETNNNYFTIERSNDAKNWQYVARINGAGNSNSVQNYSYPDVASNNNLYYRLIQTDFDGKFEAFAPVSVKCNQDVSNVYFYPNPFNDQIMIRMSMNSENATVTLRDITGRVVLQKLINAENNEAAVDVSHLAEGMYTIEFMAGKFVKTEKILKTE